MLCYRNQLKTYFCLPDGAAYTLLDRREALQINPPAPRPPGRHGTTFYSLREKTPPPQKEHTLETTKLQLSADFVTVEETATVGKIVSAYTTAAPRNWFFPRQDVRMPLTFCT